MAEIVAASLDHSASLVMVAEYSVMAVVVVAVVIFVCVVHFDLMLNSTHLDATFHNPSRINKTKIIHLVQKIIQNNLPDHSEDFDFVQNLPWDWQHLYDVLVHVSPVPTDLPVTTAAPLKSE